VTDVKVDDYLGRQEFSLSAQIKNLDLAEILDQSQALVKVAGLLEANLKTKGQGAGYEVDCW
jgi:hypothetical protein